MKMTKAEQSAVAMYAVFSRDPVDFLDMLGEATPEAIKILHKMVTTPNKKMSPENAADNKLIAKFTGPRVKAMRK